MTMQPDPAVAAAIDTLELYALQTLDVLPDGHAMWIRGLAQRMQIDFELARGILRRLRATGHVEWMGGLFSDEGMPAGSGYTLSSLGRERLKNATCAPLVPQPEAADAK